MPKPGFPAKQILVSIWRTTRHPRNKNPNGVRSGRAQLPLSHYFCASLSIFSPCMNPDEYRTTEQHSPREFKLLIKLNYSWKQFLNYPPRLPARARTLHLQVLIARLSPPKPSYQRSWCQGVCAMPCRVLQHHPYRRLGQLGGFLTSLNSGGPERQKN